MAPGGEPAVGLTTFNSRLIFGINIASFLFATIAVALRVYARRLKHASFLVEDYLIFFALTSSVVSTYGVFQAVILGAAGHPSDTISPLNIQASFRV
ncbi:MAG: hypothetical protein Q9186_004653 [Xanthomendoza sp. 1 TL-2023]